MIDLDYTTTTIDRPAKHQVIIYCDCCYREQEETIYSPLGHGRAARLDQARRVLSRREGWRSARGSDWCPQCVGRGEGRPGG